MSSDSSNMAEKNESPTSFPMGETAQERGLPYVPKCYKSQPSDTSKTVTKITEAPIIDLGGIADPARRSVLMQEVANACRCHGFFQVKNHGMGQEVLEGGLSVASSFFNLTKEEKAKYMSNDVHKPVRYGTSVKDGEDKVQFWRVFLKHYSHPLKDWISMWPDNPPLYKDKMGVYVEALQKLAQKIMLLIIESLGLEPKQWINKLEEGMQVMAVNNYPPCPQPQLALGLPPHSDYGCLTLVLQDSPGLQILHPEKKTWALAPVVEGALQVHVGDQLEVLSNGRYKSVVHRVVLPSEKARISIAGLHTLGMDVKVGAAEEMVDEQHPSGYRESSFHGFLDYISKNDIGQGRGFLDTLKIDH